MITPAYAPTATERILPRLALDFTTGVLDARVSVSRALDTATAVNSSGFVATVNANLPRFDYSPVTLAPRGLLIEESRSNLVLQSEQFSDPSWSTVDASISANAVNGPDGNLTADKLVEAATSGVHNVSQTVTVANSTVYTNSVYVKAAERTFIALYAGNPGQGTIFNLSNGTIHGSLVAPPTSSSITAAGNGWYKISITYTSVAIATAPSLYLCDNTGQFVYSGDGTSGAYIWGAQIEAGTFSTSYIPTTTTSLTRNADVVSMTGTNFSNWWQATIGAMLVRARQSIITGIRPCTHISDGTANNIIALRGNAANPELYIKATTDQAQIDAGTLVANTSYGLAGAWNTDNCAAAINGAAPVTDTSATIPTVDRMLIGSDGTDYLNGNIEKISYWPQRITNPETEAFSK